MVYGIFNVHTDVNAYDCTRGCTDAVRESALKVDCWRKIPSRTGESNLRRQRAGPMLYQLSYIPIQLKWIFFPLSGLLIDSNERKSRGPLSGLKRVPRDLKRVHPKTKKTRSCTAHRTLQRFYAQQRCIGALFKDWNRSWYRFACFPTSQEFGFSSFYLLVSFNFILFPNPLQP